MLALALLAWAFRLPLLFYSAAYPIRALTPQQLYLPPDQLTAHGFVEDRPSDLADLRPLAVDATRTATSDLQRLRRIGDLVHGWRRPEAPYVDGWREIGAHRIVEQLRNGRRGYCGHNVIAISALWRSLGGSFREVRFRSDDDPAWLTGHYGIEAYVADERRWVYYDTELNGYAVDDAERPLSLHDLDTRLATGATVTMRANPMLHNWGPELLMSFLRGHPVKVYAMRNAVTAFDDDRRFGALNALHPILSRLPSPLDRAFDVMTGDAAVRYRLDPAPGPPAPGALLQLSASRDGSAPSP